MNNKTHILYLILIIGILSLTSQADKLSRLDNGKICLAVDLSIGGSITYHADSKDKTNLINSYDWGRQVQMSFYSGPNPYIPEGATVHKSWEKLGWNPIQSGDCFGSRSKVIEHTNDGETIYVKCIPMQWPLKNVEGECYFECWYRLDGCSVWVRSRLINNRSDKTQYRGRDQELPAVYTNGAYHKLVTYTGNKPFTGDVLSEIPKQTHPDGGIKWSYWLATENWAALVDDNNFGIGVWHPGAYRFIGGFAGKPGKGGAKDSPTGYIAPLHTEILDHDIDYTYDYVLIVDKLQAIRNYIYEKSNAQNRIDFVFQSDRQHWIYHGTVDTGLPIRGCLEFKNAGKLEMISPDMLFQTKKTDTLQIVAAVKLSGGQKTANGRFYWKPFNAAGFDAKQSIAVQLPADGNFHATTIPIGDCEQYNGAITAIRLDPVSQLKSGDHIQIKSIKIH